MNTSAPAVSFDSAQLCEQLSALSSSELDALPFGVIGFDSEGLVTRYNAFEAAAAAFSAEVVIGQHVFIELAPCMNNYLIAGRFEEALEAAQGLNETMPYVLTFRMRPTRVRMRLLAMPDCPLRFVVINRAQGSAQ